jgi:hypothetical protein
MTTIRQLGPFRIGAAILLMLSGAQAQDRTQHPGPASRPMRGMMGEHAPQDMQTIHALFEAHQQITRTVKKLENGVETVTESEDAKVQVLIREHVAAMYLRLSARQPIRMWDPLYAELFKQAGKVKLEMANTPKGIKVTQTSGDPWVVKLLYAHAEGVSEFVREGMAAMHRQHPLPDAAPEKAMQVLSLQSTIGTGKDKQIEQLFDGPRRALCADK